MIFAAGRTCSESRSSYSEWNRTYSGLRSSYSGLNRTYLNLNRTCSESRSSCSGLNRTYSELRSSYSGLNRTYRAAGRSYCARVPGAFRVLASYPGTPDRHRYLLSTSLALYSVGVILRVMTLMYSPLRPVGRGWLQAILSQYRGFHAVDGFD
jgi:hypothetical protein